MRTTRRWRGELDIPLNKDGWEQAHDLGERIRAAGGVDICLHDWLSRCSDTARQIGFRRVSRGPRPWRMGPEFEGKEITEASLRCAQHLVEHPHYVPDGGESFGAWYDSWIRWMEWAESLTLNKLIVGVVTHNRNVQALYSTINGKFDAKRYNVVGPDYCSVHSYSGGEIRPWKPDRPWGVMVIRHGETDFGT